MGWFKRLFTFYLESSIHVALAVTALTFMGGYAFEIYLGEKVVHFVFLGTVTAYNLVKYAPLPGLFHRSFTRHLKAIQIFSFVVFLALCFAFFRLPLKLQFISLGFGLCTLLYALPLFGKKNLRSRYGLKIFIVAFVWSGITVLLPYFSEASEMSGDVLINFIQRFLWVLVLTLPFDIRDLVYDSQALGTLPQQLGIGKTKGVGLILLVLIVILEGFKDFLSLPYIVSQLLILMVSGLFLLFARTGQSRYYTTFWIEALPIFWLLLYWAFRTIFNY